LPADELTLKYKHLGWKQRSTKTALLPARQMCAT